VAKEYINKTMKRVYFQETDAGGVVYFGNLSRFIEIGFCEWFREFVKPMNAMHEENDIFMVVKNTEHNFIESLKYDDLICIKTTLVKAKNFSIQFKTEVVVDEKIYYNAITNLVPINDKTGKISKIPAELNPYIG
jgi:acyl-CoA thioester hydrolase